MRRTAFPRLYVPPSDEPLPKAPELPRVPVTYQGIRSVFGPVTVFCVQGTREVVSDKDWRGEDAVHLARDLLGDLVHSRGGPEQDEAFAREVLAHLPADAWEIPAEDIRSWHSRWCDRNEDARWRYPPPSDPDDELPGPEDEARMLELVKRMGRDS